jgi:hypothetical protein
MELLNRNNVFSYYGDNNISEVFIDVVDADPDTEQEFDLRNIDTFGEYFSFDVIKSYAKKYNEGDDEASDDLFDFDFADVFENF